MKRRRRRRRRSDTLLIRDWRSPLHSRCTAGDSVRPSLARQVYSHDFSTGLHPAYAISHSGGLVFFSARSTHSDPFSTDFLLSSFLSFPILVSRSQIENRRVRSWRLRRSLRSLGNEPLFSRRIDRDICSIR